MTYDTNTPIAKQLRLPQAALSKHLTNAIGILKGRRLDGLAYQKKIRVEWETRWKKQVRLARSPRSKRTTTARDPRS